MDIADLEIPIKSLFLSVCVSIFCVSSRLTSLVLLAFSLSDDCLFNLLVSSKLYDALTSKRVYKAAYSHELSVKMIVEDSGKHFDPSIVQAFIEVKEKFKEISEKYKE